MSSLSWSLGSSGRPGLSTREARSPRAGMSHTSLEAGRHQEAAWGCAHHCWPEKVGLLRRT